MAPAPKATAHVVVEPIAVAVCTESVAVSFSRTRSPVILESTQQTQGEPRFSVFTADPIEVFEVAPDESADPLAALAERVGRYPSLPQQQHPIPFVGGWVGFLTYESGLSCERVLTRRTPDAGLPLLRFGLYDSAAVFDHAANQWYAVAVDWPAESVVGRPPARMRLAAVRKLLDAASPGGAEMQYADPSAEQPVPNMPYNAYIARVERALRYIEAGDIYQVNLTQRFVASPTTTPLDNYLRLRTVNPAPFTAMLPYAHGTILCASPELFLRLQGGVVTTRPIKGTRPRVGDVERDEIAIRQLCASEKERAELNMIVDLLRNDIGRVCSLGSVRVTEPARVEEHPTVFHRVATIQGELREDCDWLDLLRATFPGGSVTGAPKIRAMQIIHELEPTPRGVYCGSIGWIGLDGTLSFNLAIRTMVHTPENVYVYAGGAIVADSDPRQEYEEIITKASGMFRALGCPMPDRSPLLQATAI